MCRGKQKRRRVDCNEGPSFSSPGDDRGKKKIIDEFAGRKQEQLITVRNGVIRRYIEK